MIDIFQSQNLKQSLRSLTRTTDVLARIMKRDSIQRQRDYAEIARLNTELKRVIPIIPEEYGEAGVTFGKGISGGPTPFMLPKFGFGGFPPLPPFPPGFGPLGPVRPRRPGEGPRPAPQVLEEEVKEEKPLTLEEINAAVAATSKILEKQGVAVEEVSEQQVGVPGVMPALKPLELTEEQLKLAEEARRQKEKGADPPFLAPYYEYLLEYFRRNQASRATSEGFFNPSKYPLSGAVETPDGGLLTVRPVGLPGRRRPQFSYTDGIAHTERLKNTREAAKYAPLIRSVIDIMGAFAGATRPRYQAPLSNQPTLTDTGTGRGRGTTTTTVIPQNNVLPGPSSTQVPARQRAVTAETPMIRGIVRGAGFYTRQKSIQRRFGTLRERNLARAKRNRNRKEEDRMRKELEDLGLDAQIATQPTAQAEAARRAMVKDLLELYKDPSVFGGGYIRPGSAAAAMGLNQPALRAKFIQYLESFTSRSGQDVNYTVIEKRLRSLGFDMPGDAKPTQLGRDELRNVLNFMKLPDVKQTFNLNPSEVVSRLSQKGPDGKPGVNPEAVKFYLERINTETREYRRIKKEVGTTVESPNIDRLNIGEGPANVKIQPIIIRED